MSEQHNEKKGSRIISIFVSAALMIMVFMIFGNAVMRYLFHFGLPITEELSRFAFVWVSILGAILAYHDNLHVGFDSLVNSLKGFKKLVLQMIAELIVIVAILLIGYSGWIYFNMTAVLKSPASDLPMGIITSSALVLAIAMLIRSLLNIKAHINEYKTTKVEVA